MDEKIEIEKRKTEVEEQGMGKGEEAPLPLMQLNSTETESWRRKSWHGARLNSFANGISRSRMEGLNGIMEALTCSNINTIGVLGPHSTANDDDLLEKVSRRAERDKLFDVVVMASVSQEPDDKRIQDEIAEALGLKFDDEKDVAERARWLPMPKASCFKFDDEKDVAKRAKKLREGILMVQKILVILRDLCKGLDLNKIGIPYGADHTGCKLLLTSASEEVLSKKMLAQKVFKV